MMPILPEQRAFWDKFELNLAKSRLPHALLLVGALHNNLLNLSYRMAAVLFCQDAQKPCGHCQSCQLMILKAHPDFNEVTSEKLHGAIRIDQIRSLQEILFTSPQLSPNRVIMINPAEKMNESAANALLKVLEEPPENTYFILLTEQPGALFPTIISRCQKWVFSERIDNYLAHGEAYSPESPRGQLFIQLEHFIESLSALLQEQVTLHALAEKWSKIELSDLMWLLYLLHAQLICEHFDSCRPPVISAKFFNLKQSIHPVILFKQLDKINAIIKNLTHNVSMNQLLVLEELLLGYRTPALCRV